ncbi:ABC transporter permease [Kosakonia sp. MUSA4]|uniref:ABC transporter permease n=1 Tax=Kosakonia sp. MUSA4 TaxID=2067958 RepID=UPI001ABFD617|nr:ABC transporter permease [Kosakonia sp. MUSA4]
MIFSSFFSRWWGIVAKEFSELRYDQLSIGLIVIIPLMQVFMFGYAINTDAHNLPAAVVDYDQSPYSRNAIGALTNTGYFAFSQAYSSEQQATDALKQGKVKFVISIPADFGRRLVRGEDSEFLLQADATDPSAVMSALAATQHLPEQILRQTLPARSAQQSNPINIVIQRVYNPESITQYNTVPGLFGIVITMTLVLMSGLAIVREKENGTMETLRATPMTSLELILGKVTPYILISIAQSFIIMLISLYIFHVPMRGSYGALMSTILLFISASTAIGIFLSVFARTQLQSMQLTFFYFLPSVLISGFMFPFQGMPEWAKAFGNMLPTTFFLRLMRGIMLKGSSLSDLWLEALFLLLLTLLFIALTFFFNKKSS